MFERRAVVSLVLRCLPTPAADGSLVGQVEVVDTGEVVAIRRVDDLIDVVRRLAGGESGRSVG